MTKYEVDNWVKIKLPPNCEPELFVIGHILEVNQQTCEAKIEQTTYIIRLWTKEAEKTVTVPIRMREIELGEKIG